MRATHSKRYSKRLSSIMPEQIRNLDIYYQNVQGLPTKANFFSNVTLTDVSIIALNETWPCSNIYLSNVFPPNFAVLRRDRVFSTRKKTLGGVLREIDASLQRVRRPDLETLFESVWIELPCANGEHILLGAYYLPSDTSPDGFRQCLLGIECTTKALNKFKFIVLGDFNVCNICWKAASVSSRSYYIIQKSNFLLNFSSFTNLKQYNCISNTQGNMLDLCFANLDCTDITEGMSGLVSPPTDIMPHWRSVYLSDMA